MRLSNPNPIGIVADFNAANESHRATNDALNHCAAALGSTIRFRWIDTEEAARSPAALTNCSGFWIGPASPYKSMEGALLAIRTAREGRMPLLGTCGGFQHIILEYARNVLGFPDAEHEETAPNASRLFVSRLSCSLYGRQLSIRLKPGSLVAKLYGRPDTSEQYRCNFGVNPDFADLLASSALHAVGSDDEGVVRAVELPDHPFFVGTLFLPQLNSTAAAPHPLVLGFVKAASL